MIRYWVPWFSVLRFPIRRGSCLSAFHFHDDYMPIRSDCQGLENRFFGAGWGYNPGMATPSTFLDFGDIRIMDEWELQRYLTDVNEEEKLQARQLWRQYSRRPDLIDFENGAKRQYTYDQKAMEYYEITGGRRTRIPITSIKMDVNSFANEMQAQQRQLMANMLNGVISIQEWYDQSARLMKLSYYAIVTIARGGDPPMDEQENYWWLLLLLALFLLLNGTAAGLQDGSIKISGRLPVSHGLRGGAVRTLFENWRIEHAKREGYTEARRFLTPAEHCSETELPGCLEEAGKGWMPINQLIPLGGCTCRSNCKCYVKFRKARGDIPRRVFP